jgi:aminoglycoside/choline kinase family phosphotransferase/dTDP-glucose pyrophosphorylase
MHSAMKAMILAAGLGTRLLPYTGHTPKPLFTLNGTPLLDISIRSLAAAGISSVVVNTHHLHDRIAAHLKERDFGIPVTVRHEPVILGTGGAVRNVSDFWDDRPFLVINGDVFTDLDFRRVIDFHLRRGAAATLVLIDFPGFNHVTLSSDQGIDGFHEEHPAPGTRRLAFTGIQMIEPRVLDRIPEGRFSSIIDLYRRLIAEGERVEGFVPEGIIWRDIGTSERYRETASEIMIPDSFRKAFPGFPAGSIVRTPLSGDGSDRLWSRLTTGDRSLVLADHGIRKAESGCEAESFTAIGEHLLKRGVPVPRIHHRDVFSGFVFLEDLGDVHLQKLVRDAPDEETVLRIYREVIELLIRFSMRGIEGFEPSWTLQTRDYDRSVILEKECRYFVEAFLNGYAGLNHRFEDFGAEFGSIADGALAFSHTGLMHRDMQSRNIMVKNGRFFFIDFQGARPGPVQYDLASLLIDPYVALPFHMQEDLARYGIERVGALSGADAARLSEGYRHCAVTRNLQILGAFGYLSRVRGKTQFEAYVPRAVESLIYRTAALGKNRFPILRATAAALGRLCPVTGFD